jgi:hypothetical protein
VKLLDASALDETALPGAREGHLVEIFETAGFGDVLGDVLVYEVEHASFEEWWEPYALGVGPAGKYVASLSDDRERLAELSREVLPPAPFTLTLAVWAARGSAP